MRRIILRHALKPALLPVLSYMGPAFVGIITGSMVVKPFTACRGSASCSLTGRLTATIRAGAQPDDLVGALTILFNAIVDVLYAVIDPNSLLKPGSP
ncbi:ABC transporter permease subunit [Klebsiella pneumoniae]|nr:ABC transporter permease subunit [Klebsiella pneumoniae]